MIDMRETVSVAIDALRSSKLRTMLTSLGVIIGSASIVLVVTVALTSKKYVISQIEAVGSNLVWVEMVKTPDKILPLSHRLTLADMAAVKESIPGVVTVAGIASMPTSVVVEGQTRQVSLIGVTDGYRQIRQLVVLRGRYFDAGDTET
jgi:putative ABC transport system permease protein